MKNTKNEKHETKRKQLFNLPDHKYANFEFIR